jgi:hypothetical protein
MISNVGNDANQPVVKDETTGGRATTPPPSPYLVGYIFECLGMKKK